MKLAMTLIVRDEDDVIEANLRFHAAQGVDFFVVADNGSTDRTREILGRYERAGLAHVIDAPSRDFSRIADELATRTARLAGTEFGADWVINADADEFWWPLTGTLRDAFAAIPAEYEIVNAPRPEFLARPDGPQPFFERMLIRETLSRLRSKAAHRGADDLVVSWGSHQPRLERGRSDDARGSGRAVLRTVGERRAGDEETRLTPAPRWPARILHFPLRSFAQYRRRVEVMLRGSAIHGKRRKELLRHLEERRLDERFEQLVADEQTVAEGLAAGTLVRDQGLRDVLTDCPDPIADGGLAAARAHAASINRPSPETLAEECSRNELDMMRTLRRLEPLHRRRRQKKARVTKQLRQDKLDLEARVQALTEERERLAAKLAALGGQR